MCLKYLQIQEYDFTIFTMHLVPLALCFGNASCANGGTCTAPNTCVCTSGWSDCRCTTGTKYWPVLNIVNTYYLSLRTKNFCLKSKINCKKICWMIHQLNPVIDMSWKICPSTPSPNVWPQSIYFEIFGPPGQIYHRDRSKFMDLSRNDSVLIFRPQEISIATLLDRMHQYWK